MALTRRQFALLLSTCCISVPPALGDTSARRPDVKAFESGDFIWPKRPGAFALYSSGSSGDRGADEAAWVRERDVFVANMQANPEGQAVARDIAQLGYREFYARYARDQDVRAISPYAGGAAFAIGHVGMVQVDNKGTPWVIEAMLGEGVVRRRYADWLEARRDYIVWHGRLEGFSKKERSKLASESLKYLRRPYNFWNLDLADDANFYCSKLVWLCAFRTFGVALDGNMTTKRTFWFSPKQLLYSSRVARLHDPGRYAVD